MSKKSKHSIPPYSGWITGFWVTITGLLCYTDEFIKPFGKYKPTIYFVSLIILAIALIVNTFRDRAKLARILEIKEENIDGLNSQIAKYESEIDDLKKNIKFQSQLDTLILSSLSEEDTKLIQNKLDVLTIIQGSEVNENRQNN